MSMLASWVRPEGMDVPNTEQRKENARLGFSSELQVGKAASLSLVWHWFGEREDAHGGVGVGVNGAVKVQEEEGGAMGKRVWVCGD